MRTLRLSRHYPTPIPWPRLWHVKHDLVARGAGSGMPETNRDAAGEETPVTSELRDLIVWVHVLAHPELTEAQVERELAHPYRPNGGWNNGKSNGWDSPQFHLNGLYPGGWTPRGVVNSIDPPRRNTAGKPYFEVECMNLSRLVWPQTAAEIDMTKWAFMTTALQDRSNPFPNFETALYRAGRCLLPIVRRSDTLWIQWLNLDRAKGGRDTFAVEPVDRILNPFEPAQWDITAGIIDP